MNLTAARFTLVAVAAIAVGIAAALVVYVTLVAAIVFLLIAAAVALLIRHFKKKRNVHTTR